MRLRLRLALALVLVLASACVADVDEPTPAGDTFIALQRDFDGFTAWQRWVVPDIGTVTAHQPGTPRVVYANAPLPAWGEPFPTGLILVKTLEVGAPTAWEVHAMAKRGGDYNAEGAVGWEWFDIVLTEGLEPVIRWRGEGSAADPGGYVDVDGRVVPCNECHAIIPSTDYVFSRGALE